MDHAMFSSDALSREARAFLQIRVARFGFASGAVGLGFLAFRALFTFTDGKLADLLEPDMTLHFLAGLAFLAAWLLCRKGTRSRRFVRSVETVSLLAGSAAYAGMGMSVDLVDQPGLIMTLALTYTIVARAIYVPSSPRRTALLGAAIALPLLASVYAAFRQMDVEFWSQVIPQMHGMPADRMARGQVIYISVWWTCSVLIATLASHVFYGLRKEVHAFRRLGQFTLEERIGKGGMGEVWRAQHRLLARPAAVKLVRPEIAGAVGSQDRQLLQRFEREAQVTAALKSPHTVDLFDFGRTREGSFYYVMELLDGLDLDKLVRRYGPLPEARVCFILEQACHSLHEAHAAGLIHRDIKPSNMILCHYGADFDFLKVLDFGLVALQPKEQSQSTRLTMEGALVGTAAYMAPEMAKDGVAGQAQTDLYSIGCVAYWLLTGRLVFEEQTPVATLVAHCEYTPEAPSKVTELPISAGMDRLVMACLEKDPGKRPASAQVLGDQLRALAAEAPWTREQARAWWETHLPQESAPAWRGETEAADAP